MRFSRSVCLLAIATWQLLATCVAANTVPFHVPYIEEFIATAQNWRTSSSAPAGAATYNAAGGPSGDSYISSAFTTPVSGPAGNAQVVFRARDQYASSGNIFFGNWIAAGVPSIDFWFRQDTGQEISLGMRLSVLDNPGQAMLARFPDKLPSGVWTHLTLDISPTNPQLVDETGPTHDNFIPVFESVNYITFFADLSGPLIPSSTVLTFGLDRFTVVPEPASWQLAVLGAVALGLIVCFRRRRATC